MLYDIYIYIIYIYIYIFKGDTPDTPSEPRNRNHGHVSLFSTSATGIAPRCHGIRRLVAEPQGIHVARHAPQRRAAELGGAQQHPADRAPGHGYHVAPHGYVNVGL